MVTLETQGVALNMSKAAPEILVVVDSVAGDYQFLEGFVQGAEVLLLERDRGGIEQISQTILDLGYDVINLYLVAHDSSGCLHLSNTELSLQSLESYGLHLAGWFLLFRFHTDRNLVVPSIYLYSCCTMSGEVGAEMTHRLHDLTEARVVVSTVPLEALEQANKRRSGG